MESTSYVELHYPFGKADLYAAFLLRGLELAKPGGLSAMLTMRNWMFLRQYTDLREYLLGKKDLSSIGDFSVGAFDDVPNDVLSVAASLVFQATPRHVYSSAQMPTPAADTSYDRARTSRKRAATLAQEGLYQFCAMELMVVPEWPLVYWWSDEILGMYNIHPLIGSRAPAKEGITTADNNRFRRAAWEIPIMHKVVNGWELMVAGADGEKWIAPDKELVKWSHNGLELKLKPGASIRNEKHQLSIGVAFTTIGSSFGGRAFSSPSIFEATGRSLFGESIPGITCLLNKSISRYIACSLNPGIHFTVGDVNRLPLQIDSESDKIFAILSQAFCCHEQAREQSLRSQLPGPSPWRHAQDWAQQAVDRPEGAPLPEYTEQLDLEPPTDHLSFALGVALGRFAPVDEQGQPTTSNPAGILDPTSADLAHALPAGLLFLDGSLAESDQRDDLGQPAAAPLHQAWARHGAAISSNRSLRDWLRLDFFKDVHKGMYENRPIHWPLSSSAKTFVAWVNIHRLDGQTLKILLADHLLPASTRIDGELDDLRQVRDSDDRKAAREADSRIGKLSRWREELQDFISAVEQCADHGAPPTDGRCPAREQDAVYAPDLDDGVMINSAALWPLLEPQWKDPKKWWKELASSQGKKDYDWAHLAMRYWPTRVDEKCQKDPSLAVAHRCFWLYHPERAWAWELRLQQEIGPDFRIEEAPYRPGGRDIGDQGDAPHRQAWLSEHPNEALAAVEKEAIRRMGRGNDRQVVNEMRLLEQGLWSVIPEKVAAIEQRLGDKQGAMFSLRAPDEAEGRAAIGEQVVQTGLFLAEIGMVGSSTMIDSEAKQTPC
jgi:hypothetical protein